MQINYKKRENNEVLIQIQFLRTEFTKREIKISWNEVTENDVTYDLLSATLNLLDSQCLRDKVKILRIISQGAS